MITASTLSQPSGFVSPHETTLLIERDFVWEATGEADIVLDDLADHLAHTPHLYDDLREKVGHFTSNVSSPLLFLKLEVSDKKPEELDTFNPNEIHVYLGSGEVKTNQSIRTMRYTNVGTRTSISTMADDEAFMAATLNTQKGLILSLGSFRTDDLTALDVDFDGLIDTLAAMGIAEDVIEEMIALLISGDAPTALLEAVQAILDLGKVPDATAITALLSKLENALSEAVVTAKSEKITTMVKRIADGLQPLVQISPAILMPKIQAFQRGEAPKLSERLSALKVITNVVQTTAALIHNPDLPKADKEKLSVTLAALRANIFNPQSPVFNQAFVRLATQIMPLAEKFAVPITLGATTAKPSMISLRIADAMQAVTKAAIILMPPAARQALSLPIGGADKPSTLLNTKLSMATIQNVAAVIAKPAITVSTGRMTFATPLTAPRTVMHTIKDVSTPLAAPVTRSRFAGTTAQARNDNQAAVLKQNSIQAATRSIISVIGSVIARQAPQPPVAPVRTDTAAPIKGKEGDKPAVTPTPRTPPTKPEGAAPDTPSVKPVSDAPRRSTETVRPAPPVPPQADNNPKPEVTGGGDPVAPVKEPNMDAVKEPTRLTEIVQNTRSVITTTFNKIAEQVIQFSPTSILDVGKNVLGRVTDFIRNVGTGPCGPFCRCAEKREKPVGAGPRFDPNPVDPFLRPPPTNPNPSGPDLRPTEGPTRVYGEDKVFKIDPKDIGGGGPIGGRGEDVRPTNNDDRGRFTDFKP